MSDPLSDALLRNLVDRQILPIEKAREIRDALTGQPKELFTALVTSKLISEEEYTKSKAVAYNLPYINLAEVTISKEILDVIPESTAKGHLIVPYELNENVLKVAMVDPSDRQIIEFIHKKMNLPVETALASESGIRDSLNKYQETLEVELQSLIDAAKTVKSVKDDSSAAEDVPIIKITDAILKHAILQGASDIHIEPTENSVVIRYRIDGILHDMLVLGKHVLTGLIARIKVLSNLKIDEHRLPQDGRFKIEFDEYKVAFRVSTLPVFDGEKVVMRLLDESGHGLGLDDIGMTKRALEIFRRNISKPHGMILVTGPTGSGKTTTLYAAMKELNQPDVNISTIEDPIEYRMERINQTQVQPRIGLTFSVGLRALVRQDPDIIMVGEIRDEETASLAVNAALTGHLVLSTLHTNSAAGAVPRLLDMNVEPFLISSTTNVLMAQRLVRRLCDKCRKQVPVTATVIESLETVIGKEQIVATLTKEGVLQEGKQLTDMVMYEAVGCNKCHDGYKGRAGIYEMLEVTPSVQKLIVGKMTTQELEDLGKKEQNMVTMIEDGVIKAMQGLTTIEEVLRVAKE